MSIPSIFNYLPADQARRLIRQDNEKTAGVGKGLKVVAKGLAGFGAGTAAGIGLAALGNKVYHAATGEQIPADLLIPAAGLLGAGMGVAYSMYKSTELEELQNALKDRRKSAGGGHPGK